MEQILLAALVTILSAAATVLYFRASNYQERFEDTWKELMETQEDYGRLEENHDYLKKTINHTVTTILNRPVVATLSDEQVQRLAEILNQYQKALSKDPAKLD